MQRTGQAEQNSSGREIQFQMAHLRQRRSGHMIVYSDSCPRFHFIYSCISESILVKALESNITSPWSYVCNLQRNTSPRPNNFFWLKLGRKRRRQSYSPPIVLLGMTRSYLDLGSHSNIINRRPLNPLTHVKSKY